CDADSFNCKSHSHFTAFQARVEAATVAAPQLAFLASGASGGAGTKSDRLTHSVVRIVPAPMPAAIFCTCSTPPRSLCGCRGLSTCMTSRGMAWGVAAVLIDQLYAHCPGGACSGADCDRIYESRPPRRRLQLISGGSS